MVPGKCFIDIGHLWVILSPACEYGKSLIVNLTSLKNTFRGNNHTCVLRKGDHSFIVKDTVVSYCDARIIIVSEFHKDIDKKILNYYKEDFRKEILDRIIDGLNKEANSLPIEIEEYCNQIGLIKPI